MAASTDLARAEAFARTYTEMQGGAPVAACGSYAELLKRDDVDVVYVGTVNTAHFAAAMACIEAGKHCVCEKPIGVNGHEAAALAAAAQAKGVRGWQLAFLLFIRCGVQLVLTCFSLIREV